MRNILKAGLLLTAIASYSLSVSAAGITPEQLKLVNQLSPQDKAALARQYGVSLPVHVATPNISSPKTVETRKVGKGPMESVELDPTADEKQLSAEVAQSAQVDVPVVEISGQKAADKIEVRRAFSDFVTESKPLEVDASQLQQFGYNLFAGVPTTFAPATDVPVPSEYVLGPGDELAVQLFGRESSVFSLVVDREGMVSFPNMGPLKVASLNFSEAKAYLAQQVAEKLVGQSVSVNMGKLRSIRIFALGEVERPGSYVVSGLATLSHALFASGGVKKIGSLRNIQLKRNGKIVTTIDLYDFLLKGDTSRDVRLLPGDVVFIPPIGATAAIAGKVIRPAIYELKKESDVGYMVNLAGGFLPKAYRDEAILERINKTGNKSVINFELRGQGLKTRVQNGDVIKVFSALDSEENPVLLIGNVKRPGKYAWKKDMHLSDLITGEEMLLPETFMDYGIIEREAVGNREPEILRFTLSELFKKGKQFVDYQIQPRDKVYVFHRSHFRVAPKANIAGSVKSPGSYALKKNMHLLDLILASGGVQRDTSLEEAELYREDPVTKTVQVQRFNLGKVMAGNLKENVLLQDLDRVVIHSVWEKQRRYEVRITGEVNNPGQYVFAENGMRVSDLVFAAGGVTDKALLTTAEISRFDVIDGEARESTHFEVALAKAIAGDSDANIALQPYDVMTIRQVSNWRAAENVTITGEVKYPGVYPIEDGEHLSKLVERAGGFSSDAYLRAAVFTRESIKVEQQREMAKMSQQIESEIAQLDVSISGIHDSQLYATKQKSLMAAKRVLEELKLVKASGRLVIQMSDVEELKKSGFDMTLRDGDKLHIPKKPDQVLVMGQVYNSVALLYHEDNDVDDYIDEAGGMTRMADESRIYIVRASGRVDSVNQWGLEPVQPGDAIIVPEDLERLYVLDSILDWSKAMMQIGVGLASMKTIGIL